MHQDGTCFYTRAGETWGMENKSPKTRILPGQWTFFQYNPNKLVHKKPLHTSVNASSDAKCKTFAVTCMTHIKNTGTVSSGVICCTGGQDESYTSTCYIQSDVLQVSRSEWLCTSSLGSVLVWFSCSACSVCAPPSWGTLKSWCLRWTRSWKRLAGGARSSWRTSLTTTSQTPRPSVGSHSRTGQTTSSAPPLWQWRWSTERWNIPTEPCPTETSGHTETPALTPFIRLKPIQQLREVTRTSETTAEESFCHDV